MLKISHNKLKNTAILFELLVRAVTADTLSNKNSPAVDIIKKHFIKTELSKEYKLYEILFKKTQLTEGKAEIIINTVLESSKKLNKPLLNKQKYNLIKDIKENYDLGEFFKTKIPNYKHYAAFYNLMEIINNNVDNPQEVINNKTTILEYLTNFRKPVIHNQIVDEYEKYDKDIRILSYKIASDKFNEKYADLNNHQKAILKEYINSVDNVSKLRDFYNKKVNEIKTAIIDINTLTTNKITQIKIKESIELLKPIHKSNKIKDEDMVNLMQYCELLEELQKINK